MPSRTPGTVSVNPSSGKRELTTVRMARVMTIGDAAARGLKAVVQVLPASVSYYLKDLPLEASSEGNTELFRHLFSTRGRIGRMVFMCNDLEAIGEESTPPLKAILVVEITDLSTNETTTRPYPLEKGVNVLGGDLRVGNPALLRVRIEGVDSGTELMFAFALFPLGRTVTVEEEEVEEPTEPPTPEPDPSI